MKLRNETKTKGKIKETAGKLTNNPVLEKVGKIKRKSNGSKAKSVRQAQHESTKSSKFSEPISADDRRLMISQAAYFETIERGASDGDSLSDWLTAEKAVDAELV